jgi:hypothetical protein
MSNKRLLCALILGLGLSFAFGSIVVSGQQPQKNANPQEKPRTVKPELKNAYKVWINEDVRDIITDAERRAFNRLSTDEERDNCFYNPD